MLPLLATIRSRIPLLLRSASVDRARGDQPGRDASAQNGRDAADGLNDELIGELIGEDERGRRGSVGGVDRQRDLLVEVLDGLERAVAVADQDLHVAQRVADEQVGIAVAVQVRDGQAIGLEADVVLRRRQEASLAVSYVDEESVGLRTASPVRPSPLKSTARTTSPVAGVGR